MTTYYPSARGVLGIILLTFISVSSSVYAQVCEPSQRVNEVCTAEDNVDIRTEEPPSRIFGVLPNYTAVEGTGRLRPLTTDQKFRMARLGSFDPYVFPFVGVVAGLGAGQGSVDYGRRYAMALADNSIGNFMTTAVVASAFHQDPRYFEKRIGGGWHRATYALTRTIVTRNDSGSSRFNISEMGGTALSAGMTALYYPAEDRSLANTLTRWGTQVMWDALSNELKEFWPDVRRRLRRQ